MSDERLIIETLLRIPDKEGRDVDFILNADQRRFDAEQTGRDIIAKYRQGGFSTYPLGRTLVRCLGFRNRRHVIIAHNTDTTQKLLARIHYMVKHFKGPSPDIKYSTQNRIHFGKTDSSIFIGTAGSDDYGVGDTITDLHCSEVSRWSNPEALLSGLFQAVPPSGNILLESTGRGTGNWFHKAVMRASRGGAYKLHFFNWLNTPEYRIELSPAARQELLENLDPNLDEPKYYELGLSPEQLAWRRMKLEELNYDTRLFMENYPTTLAECFQATGFGIFNEVNYVQTQEWKAVDPWTWILGDHPRVGLGYFFGVDPAGGVGKDYSVIEGFNVETGEQVLEYRNNMIQPDRFASKVVDIASRFNSGYINPERNNHGPAVIKAMLNSGYPQNKIHKKMRTGTSRSTSDLADLMDFGTYTTEQLKAAMIEELQSKARTDLTLHSEVLRLEMGSFVETETGRMAAEEGCFDDCVMATALAVHVWPKAMRMLKYDQEVARKERGMRTTEIFEAGRAIDSLVHRFESRGEHGLPVGAHLEWQ